MSNYPVPQCQHVKVNGSLCGSPAVRDHKFCYFHQRCSSAQFDASPSAARPAAFFFLPVLEDAASIQMTITQVCEHLLHRHLDPKKAGMVLYATQLAASNLARLNQEKTRQNNLPEAPAVPASSERSVTGQADSVPADEPGSLPPGTIQASEQRRRPAV